MSKKKISSTDILRSSNLIQSILHKDDSFEIPKETEVYYESSCRSSLLTNCSTTNENYKYSGSFTKKRTCSQPQQNSGKKLKRKRVKFNQLEIVDIASFKQYNKQAAREEKFNGCACIVF